MKRLFFILAAALMTVGVMAKATIQNTFMGLTLGKASQKEVQDVLSSQGFELQTDTGGLFMYHGKWQAEGVPVTNLVVRFVDDTLVMLVLGNACEETCDSLKQIIDKNVEKKYGLLQSGDSSLFIKMFALGSVPLGMEQWSRMDDESSFIYGKSDSSYVFIYLAENFIWNRLYKSYKDIVKEVSPDYAEENMVKGVAGVKFGDSYDAVRRVLVSKGAEVAESDEHHIMFVYIKVGGIEYSYAEFYFKQGQGLISATLTKSFRSWQEEEAKMFYEVIAAQYENKYSNFKQNKEGTYAFCGAYTDTYKDMPPIVISREKSLSRGGDIMYYVTVTYYLKNREGMYDDEI